MTKIANAIIETPRNQEMLLDKASIITIIKTLDPELGEKIVKETEIVE